MTLSANQKREIKTKQEPHNGKRTGHVVCVTNVPSTLCANERTVRHLFAEYGMLLSVTIHHNFLDMEPDGFIYVEYSEKDEAKDAIAAVKEKRVGLAACADVKSVLPLEMTEMKAAMALVRGEMTVTVDEEVKDILLGRHERNRFMQSPPADEEDLMLQSLSQHSFGTSQSKKKRQVSGRPKKKKKKKLQGTLV